MYFAVSLTITLDITRTVQLSGSVHVSVRRPLSGLSSVLYLSFHTTVRILDVPKQSLNEQQKRIKVTYIANQYWARGIASTLSSVGRQQRFTTDLYQGSIIKLGVTERCNRFCNIEFSHWLLRLHSWLYVCKYCMLIQITVVEYKKFGMEKDTGPLYYTADWTDIKCKL